MKRDYLLLPIISLLAVLLRLFFLSDMEYKQDEKDIVAFILHLPNAPFTPNGPLSGHSGIAHSSGFYYLVWLLSLGSPDPLAMARAIALFNGLSIVLSLLLLRRSPKFVLLFAMCATSTVLVMQSRKIWSPDMVAAFNILAIAFFSHGRELESGFRKFASIGIAAFCLIIAGHMYLPGVLFALIVSASILIPAFLQEKRDVYLSWIAGSVIGWATYLPYALSFLQATAPRGDGTGLVSLSVGSLASGFWSGLTLPGPYPVFDLYLRPLIPIAPLIGTPLFYITVLFSIAGSIIWAAIFLFSLYSTLRDRKTLLDDPLRFSAVAILVLTPFALLLTKLGSHLNYWLGALPFFYYLIASSHRENSLVPYARYLTGAIWIACGISAIVFLQLAFLVHLTGGLPGEYGPGYSSQTTDMR